MQLRLYFLRSVLCVGVVYMMLGLQGCTKYAAPTVAITPSATPTLIDCADATPRPEVASILPTFAPSYPCELEHVSRHVDFCLVHASPDLSYPCSQTETVEEAVVGDGSHTRLIQRDFHMDGGCWHGVSSDVRSLRLCDTGNGSSTTLAENIRGDLFPSPDGLWFAFAALAQRNDLSVNLFSVRADGADLIQLDAQSFPQAQVVGARMLRWSENGDWLDVSLWDGSEDGWHDYRIRTDGSGRHETLPGP